MHYGLAVAQSIRHDRAHYDLELRSAVRNDAGIRILTTPISSMHSRFAVFFYWENVYIFQTRNDNPASRTALLNKGKLTTEGEFEIPNAKQGQRVPPESTYDLE